VKHETLGNLSRRSRERDLCVALVCQRLLLALAGNRHPIDGCPPRERRLSPFWAIRRPGTVKGARNKPNTEEEKHHAHSS